MGEHEESGFFKMKRKNIGRARRSAANAQNTTSGTVYLVKGFGTWRTAPNFPIKTFFAHFEWPLRSLFCLFYYREQNKRYAMLQFSKLFFPKPEEETQTKESLTPSISSIFLSEQSHKNVPSRSLLSYPFTVLCHLNLFLLCGFQITRNWIWFHGYSIHSQESLCGDEKTPGMICWQSRNPLRQT